MVILTLPWQQILTSFLFDGVTDKWFTGFQQTIFSRIVGLAIDYRRRDAGLKLGVSKPRVSKTVKEEVFAPETSEKVYCCSWLQGIIKIRHYHLFCNVDTLG